MFVLYVLGLRVEAIITNEYGRENQICKYLLKMSILWILIWHRMYIVKCFPMGLSFYIFFYFILYLCKELWFCINVHKRILRHYKCKLLSFSCIAVFAVVFHFILIEFSTCLDKCSDMKKIQVTKKDDIYYRKKYKLQAKLFRRTL